MGILSWWKGKGSSSEATTTTKVETSAPSQSGGEELPGMHGAEEVRRPSEITVFEFGSVSLGSSNDRITLAGFCPVSEDLEPCRWQILPASSSDDPQFRVVF